MTPDSTSSTLIPDQLYLEIPTAEPPQAAYSHPGNRWRAALNQLALEAFLPWLREESAVEAQVWPNRAALPALWELVNGTAIVWGSQRIVLIPTEAIDLDELRVPQEWVDIPAWAADYYVGLQVNGAEGWVRVWGYTTHQRLKQATYDPSDRSYSLESPAVFADINILGLAQQFSPQMALRAEVAPLPALPLEQAENLLTRLGNPQLAFPRLQIPFAQWGALLSHGGWRRRLYELRQGLPEQWSLSRWFQGEISALGQQLGWQRARLHPATAATGGWRSQITTGLLRPLAIAGQRYELQIVSIDHPTERVWQFELRRAEPGRPIPPGVVLRLLTEDLQPFDNNEDRGTGVADCLQVTVILAAGEGIVWEVEPRPEAYDQEILRF